MAGRRTFEVFDKELLMKASFANLNDAREYARKISARALYAVSPLSEKEKKTGGTFSGMKVRKRYTF